MIRRLTELVQQSHDLRQHSNTGIPEIPEIPGLSGLPGLRCAVFGMYHITTPTLAVSESQEEGHSIVPKGSDRSTDRIQCALVVVGRSALKLTQKRREGGLRQLVATGQGD